MFYVNHQNVVINTSSAHGGASTPQASSDEALQESFEKISYSINLPYVNEIFDKKKKTKSYVLFGLFDTRVAIFNRCTVKFRIDWG